MSNQLIERCYRIIRSNRYLTLATSEGLTPWVAPVAYVVDCDMSFLFYSALESLHARHIAKNPAVACAVFDSTASSDGADGIQLSATATIVSIEELPRVVNLYFRKSFPDASMRAKWIRPVDDFSDTSVQRFFRLRPTALYTLDLSSTKVDRRVEVDLTQLRKRFEEDCEG